MEKWFVRRRKSKVLEIAHRQMTLAIDTVTDLEKAIVAASKGRAKEAREYIERLFVTEREIDKLRRVVFGESTKGSLPSKDREDLMHLVKRLDVMADDVKDSGRSVLVLLDAEVPGEVWDLCVRIAKDLVECATILRGAIEKLGEKPEEAVGLAKRVDKIESRVDEKYLEGKRLLLERKELDCAVLIVLKELFDFMEEVADSCCDTSDYVRILAVS